ncbi:hypothetical protein ACHAXR_005948, partial [Thalassiosira sp. AJA248-18]
YLPSYLPAFLPTHLINFLPTNLPSYLLTFSPTCLLAYLPSYLPAFLPTHLINFLPTYLLLPTSSKKRLIDCLDTREDSILILNDCVCHKVRWSWGTWGMILTQDQDKIDWPS